MILTMNMMKTHTSFASMYKAMLEDVLFEPDYVASPRGKEVKERCNTRYVCSNPMSNLFINKARSIPKKYLAGELLWYFTGDNKLDTISKYSGFWSGIANDDGTLNSAYGHLLFNKHNGLPYSQWQWAIKSLIDDKDSRQAVMYFGRPDYQIDGTKDFVCTTYAMLLIRNNKLHMYLYMRSNDIIKGATFDIPFFMLLQQQAWKQLKVKYEDLELGSYFHNATSLHLYEPDYGLANEMLRQPFEEHALPEIKHFLVDFDGTCRIADQNDTTDELFTWLYTNS